MNGDQWWNDDQWVLITVNADYCEPWWVSAGYIDEYIDEYSDKYSDKYSDEYSDEYSDKYSDEYSDK